MANKIFINDLSVEIQATKDDKAILSLLSYFKTVHANRAGTVLELSSRHLPEVLDIMRGVVNSDMLPEPFKGAYDKEMLRRVITEELLLNGPTEQTELWTWQQLGVELARVNDRWGFFYDTRTGKTAMSLKIIEEDIAKNPDSRWIIVSSAYLIETAWIPDLQKFTPDLSWNFFYGNDKEKLKAYTAKGNILFVSTALFSKFNELYKTAEGLIPSYFVGCFFDESSTMKSHKTNISKAALEFSPNVKRWYLLSATPAPNDESEYYTQMLTIDSYIWPTSRNAFKGMYFDDFSRSHKYEDLKIKPEMFEPFMSLIKQYATYTDQGVMPTAGKAWSFFTFNVPTDLAIAYTTMKNELALEIGDDETKITVATMALVRAKLKQLASGFIIDTQAIKDNKTANILYGAAAALGTETHVLSRYRVEQLQKLIEQIHTEEPNAKIVIWANYHKEFELIRDALGDTEARYIYGKTSAFKTQYIKDFKLRPSIKYLIAHPMSVGMGVNLTEAHHCIYYSMTDSWEQFKQSQERIAGHIVVQPRKCIYWIMQANGTVDEIIYDNVNNKREQSYGILNHLKAGIFK